MRFRSACSHCCWVWVIAIVCTPALSLLLLAWLNRMVLALVVGWGIMRDRRALWLCWLYPLRDLLGFGVWAASFSGKTFFWRGETYQFGDGGRITPEQRPISLLSRSLPQGHD